MTCTPEAGVDVCLLKDTSIKNLFRLSGHANHSDQAVIIQ